MPMQLFKPKEPHVGKIISVKRIVGEKAVGDVFEIVIDHGGKMPYWEGQSYGVVPPGIILNLMKVCQKFSNVIYNRRESQE